MIKRKRAIEHRLIQEPKNYELLAEWTAITHGIDPYVFKAQIRQESGFNPTIISYQDGKPCAYGIAQFIPSTGRMFGLNSQKDLFNPRKALRASARMMKGLLNKYGTYERALSAYNSGYPNAYKDPSFAKGQTYNYVIAIKQGAKRERRLTE
ncbi:MAG: lytic transglycosylase domain-containing protein [Smithella sp.]